MRIAQVLNNLISNAVKYSPKANKLVISASEDGHNITISVEALGVGIPPEVQKKIFGRFFRVAESSGNRVSGLGLGLYIASQIVHQQVGK